MTDKELRHLNRRELLEILVDISRSNEELKQENAELKARIEDRELRCSEAGSLAEAAFRLNGVFEAAQAAADQYLENVKNTDSICARKQQEAEENAAAILNEARARARAVVEEAEKKAQELLASPAGNAAEPTDTESSHEEA